MEERTSGIILRTRPLTETSLVVEWLTPDLGRISTVAKGARRPKSPFHGKLDLFYEAEFSFGRSRRSELHNLREVVVRKTNAGLRRELNLLNQGAYFVVLLERSTERETPIPELHELFTEALAVLANQKPDSHAVFVFELKLLCALGYEPSLDSLTAPLRAKTETAMNVPFAEALAELSSLDPARSSELNRFLNRSIGQALEKVPPQRDRALSG